MRTSILCILFLASLASSGCGRAKSTDELIGDLSAGQEGDRIKAARILPQRSGDSAKVVPALMASLKDKESDVRWSAAIGLGYFHEQASAAIPALREAQRDRDARVREAANVALSRIDPNQFPVSSQRKPARAR
jgi:HEAT repeat protein